MIPFALHAGPGAAAAHGADLLQEPMVESPLPGGVAAVVRFLFNLPAWFQIAGAVTGAVVAAAVVWILWRRRRDIVAWLRTRSRRVIVWLGATAAVVVLSAATFGAASWNYMQHDNGFCTGCHVMDPAFTRFTESEHATLACHDCHQQSIFASMRQLYLWVAERPAEIGPHAKVPNAVCARCHVTDEPEIWQRIASTAGHRTHLESHEPALSGIQCVTCHAVEVHRFAPLAKTCGQAGCHAGTGIVLGDMRGQTALHCTMCHQFTAPVPALATRDSAAGTLVPGFTQCFSCHEMRGRLPGLDLARDPHRGTCGMCHNPHRQETTAAARQTCTRCHATWRDIPFHSGANHRRAGPDCLTCHLPHAARVDPSDCAGCHAAVRDRRSGRAPPVPFDTTTALRRTSWGHFEGEPKGKGDASWVGPPGRPWQFSPPDTFSHERHNHLTCLTCHGNPSGQGRLTFKPPRGCQICHHQAPATSECSTCHEESEYQAPRQVTLSVAVGARPPRERTVVFKHDIHTVLGCVACHNTPVTLARSAACADCHVFHHGAGRECSACHVADAAVRVAHAPPTEAHVKCAACHAEDVIAALEPDRLFCLTCHTDKRQHHVDRPCAVCHLLASPDVLQRRLTEGWGGGGAE